MLTTSNAEGEAMNRSEEPDLHPPVRQPPNRDDDHDESGDGSQEKNQYEIHHQEIYQHEIYEADKYDFLNFMKAAGIEEEELLAVIAELDAYKSIPGTTLRRYLNRVLSSVETDCRLAFLKGMIVGTAICENLAVEEGDLEGRIDAEVKRRLQLILDDLDRL